MQSKEEEEEEEKGGQKEDEAKRFTFELCLHAV